MSEWCEAPVFGVHTGAERCTIRPSAYGLVADGGGRLAVVRTPCGLFLPGGGIELGETPGQAVVREVLEECGLAVRLGTWSMRAVQLVHSRSEGTDFEKRSTFLEAPLAGPIERNARGLELDHELQWMPAAAAAELLTHASHGWAVASWEKRGAQR